MKLWSNWKFISFLGLIGAVSTFDLLLANNNSFRFYIQNYVWNAPETLKNLISSEIGEPYTVLSVGNIDNPSKVDELKALKFWFTFEMGDEFIAVSPTNRPGGAISFYSLHGTIGSYYLNILEYKSTQVKDACLLGMQSKIARLDKGDVKERFLIVEDLYVLDISKLKSTEDNLFESKCNS